MSVVHVVATVCVIAAVASAQQQLDVSTKMLVARATSYVANYHTQFKFLVADEEYVQRTFDARGAPTGARHMRGELFLAYLIADGTWIAVHDVAEVDGRPVPERENLRVLLQTAALAPIARRIADRNAGFNIGGIERNFNEPTLPLLLLDGRRVKGVSFGRRDFVEHAGGARVTLTFKERDRPTLIRSRTGGSIFSSGFITIDAATGRVEQSQLDLVDAPVRARLTTRYALDEKLGVWVPVVFTERYEGKPDGSLEVILAEATYTNYRRFEVTGRIK